MQETRSIHDDCFTVRPDMTFVERVRAESAREHMLRLEFDYHSMTAKRLRFVRWLYETGRIGS